MCAGDGWHAGHRARPGIGPAGAWRKGLGHRAVRRQRRAGGLRGARRQLVDVRSRRPGSPHPPGGAGGAGFDQHRHPQRRIQALRDFTAAPGDEAASHAEEIDINLPAPIDIPYELLPLLRRQPMAAGATTHISDLPQPPGRCAGRFLRRASGERHRIERPINSIRSFGTCAATDIRHQAAGVQRLGRCRRRGVFLADPTS